MTTRKRTKDEEDAELQRELDEGLKRELAEREKEGGEEKQGGDTRTPLAEVPPGSSEPDMVPPSVVGTSQDPNRAPTAPSDQKTKED